VERERLGAFAAYLSAQRAAAPAKVRAMTAIKIAEQRANAARENIESRAQMSDLNDLIRRGYLPQFWPQAPRDSTDLKYGKGP